MKVAFNLAELLGTKNQVPEEGNNLQKSLILHNLNLNLKDNIQEYIDN
jgi:hypothetical protein